MKNDTLKEAAYCLTIWCLLSYESTLLHTYHSTTYNAYNDLDYFDTMRVQSRGYDDVKAEWRQLKKFLDLMVDKQ